MLTVSPMLTIEQVAERHGVDRDAVSGWIKSKELLAVNVARDKRSKRPTWRIRPEDLETFELSRRTTNSSAPQARKRRVKRPPTAKQWV